MQFYLNGYAPGDPDLHAVRPGVPQRPSSIPDKVDVLIVGSGIVATVLRARAAPGAPAEEH